VYALFAWPAGIIADKLGMKKVFMLGIFLFSLVYFGMSITDKLSFFILFFLLYGIYAATTEGIAKAWISNIADKKETATAIGTYTAFQSICSLLASTFAGLIWFEFGASITLICTGTVSTIVLFYFLLLKQQ
jgi:MFS family permease